VRKIFITGANGHVGGRLIKEILTHGNDKIYALVRGKSQKHAEQRMSDVLSFWGEPLKKHRNRITILKGDVSQKGFGISPRHYSSLVKSVTHVIHAAGQVNLSRPIEEARRQAVNSLTEIITLCQRCLEHGQFQKLDYVSTIGVAGRMQGAVKEEQITGDRKFHNTYEQAKAEAEEIIFQEMNAGRLPATIHRPSMVVGDSKTGKLRQFQVFYHLVPFLAGLKTRGILPQFRSFRLDLIPSDYVARAIYLSSRDQRTSGRVFHLCAGTQKSWGLTQLGGEIRKIYKRRGEQLHSIKSIPVFFLKCVLPVIKLLSPKEHRRAVGSLKYFLDYLSTRQTFVNAQTNATFTKKGLKIPHIKNYIKTLLDYYWARTT
jgi:thioester reductase-like protein